MFTSFSTALSALAADSTAIDVVGNNLANLNTPGFKTSAVRFRDLVTESLGAGLGETQVGFGTGQPLTVREFSQGAIQTSSGLLDAAVQGDGFFVVSDNSGNQLYTRAGSFQTDKAGNLLTDTGYKVQGWTAVDPTTGQIDTNGSIGNIVVPVGSLKPPSATSEFTADLNLNSAAAADTTSNFTTPLTVYDSLGTSHVLTLSFQKTGANQWSYQVQMPGDEISGGTTGTPFDISGASGTLTFGTDGKLTDPAVGSPIQFSIPGLSDGGSDMNLSWNPYTAAGVGRITQFGQPSAPSAQAQNGSAAAQLDHVGLATGGQILAEYTDGTQVVVAQVALASIRNPDSLIAAGNNAFHLSALTANPSVGTPGTGGRGSIQGGAVEASTVDIATEFTSLIVYQRAYEANAHVVTTADTLSQDTINLIR
ncbi:MAG TPA: flagellar hook protein FlgE [Candidatus Sulfopaludibacter sp.]|jgi:flagellar hook protein FlgE|nr:flagellar hook protein FlgE [Candidatus Sulfopaludibacter sp.]